MCRTDGARERLGGLMVILELCNLSFLCKVLGVEMEVRDVLWMVADGVGMSEAFFSFET